MAGSFLHLHLALGAFPAAFGLRPEQPGVELPAFLAGSIAPDVGYFPGGPAAFSNRVHHESTGDLVRALLQQASTPAEIAFAAGWALHVEVDVATHPLVNQLAAEVGDQTRPDLWHKRVEWGFDCRVLEASHGRPRLCDQPLNLPVDHLARAARPLFGDDADATGLHAGARALPLWLRRIASILAVSSGPWHRLARLASIAQHFQPLEDAVALLTPRLPSQDLTLQFLSCAAGGVAAFQRGWVQRFVHMQNRDLDTGCDLDSGRDHNRGGVLPA